MKVIKKIIALNLIFVSIELLGVPAMPPVPTTSQQTKISQARSKAATAKSNASAAKPNVQSARAQKAAAPQHAPKAASALQQESGDVKELIENFIAAMEEIKCSCGSMKKGEKVDHKMLCKHDSQHATKVKNAFEMYKKLHRALHEEKKSITKEDDKKVRPHINKLFTCKNIKDMAWHPKVSH